MTDDTQRTDALDASVEPPRARVLVEKPIDVRSVALTLIAVAVAVALLQFMHTVLIPIVLATLLFYALDPFVDRMQGWHVPHVVGARRGTR